MSTYQTRPNHTAIVRLWAGGAAGRRRLIITPHAAAAYTVYQPAEATPVHSLGLEHCIADAISMAANARPDVLMIDASRECFGLSSVANAFTFTLEEQ